MTTTRFKTRQEFEKEFGEGWKFRLTTHWNDGTHMDHLFGTIYPTNKSVLGYPCEWDTNWSIRPDMLTTAPHPYLKGDYAVSVPQGQHDKVQAKAFACGFKWVRDANQQWLDDFHWDYLLIRNGVLSQADEDYIKIETFTRLTLEQFMDGSVPEKEKDLLSENQYYCIATPDQAVNYGVTQKHPVLLITLLTPASDGQEWGWTEDLSLADKRTMISYEEFREKYPPKLKSKKLFGHEVTFVGDYVKVGCQTYTTNEVKAFLKIAEEIVNMETEINDNTIEKITKITKSWLSS